MGSLLTERREIQSCSSAKYRICWTQHSWWIHACAWEKQSHITQHIQRKNSIRQNPSWVATRYSVGQAVINILWNPKVHHRVHKIPLPDDIMSQTNPIHTLPLHFFMIHFIIIILHISMSPKRSLSCRMSIQNTLLSLQHAPPISSSYSVSIIIWQIIFHNLSVLLMSRTMDVCHDLFN